MTSSALHDKLKWTVCDSRERGKHLPILSPQCSPQSQQEQTERHRETEELKEGYREQGLRGRQSDVPRLTGKKEWAEEWGGEWRGSESLKGTKKKKKKKQEKKKRSVSRERKRGSVKSVRWKVKETTETHTWVQSGMKLFGRQLLCLIFSVIKTTQYHVRHLHFSPARSLFQAGTQSELCLHSLHHHRVEAVKSI